MTHLQIKDLFSEKIGGEWGKEPSAMSHAVPVIRTTNFKNDGTIDYTEVVLRDIEPSKLTNKFLQPQDIIIEKSGGSDKQPVGRVVFFNAKPNTFVCNNFTQILRVNSAKYWPRYVFYYLYSLYSKGMTLSYQNKTTGIRNLQLAAYLDCAVKCHIPNLSEQKQIAERLDKVQNLIALQKEQLKKLDELIKSRFIDLFGDPITNPKGWPLKRMGDLYYLKAGQTTKANVIHPYSEDYSVPCYGGNGIRGYVQTSTYEGIFPIIGRQGALCGNIQLASGKFHATEHAVLVTPLKGDQPLYVYHLLKDMNLYRFHGGAAQPGLAVKTLNEINIIDVPHNLQTQFADFVTKIESQKGLLTTRLSHLETLYKSLMQEYFG